MMLGREIDYNYFYVFPVPEATQHENHKGNAAMHDRDKTKQQLIDELAELRESERHYRLFTEALPQMLWRADANRQTIENNRRWHEYTGQTPEEGLGFGWMKALHPDDVARAAERVQNSQAAGKPYEAEYRVRRASDGSYRWHLSRALPVKDEQGRITGWFGSVTDIDDQKRAEQALQESEAKYRRLHQTMMDAFVSVDMDGFLREYNDAYLKMLGYTPEELAALRYTDLTPEKWHVDEARIVQDQILSRGYSDIYEKEYRRKDGTIFPVEMRTFLIKDDKDQPSAMWAIVRDISKRKRTEEALQKAHDELEERIEARTAELREVNKHLRQLTDELQMIYNEMIEGILITDVETKRFVRVNSSMCRMLGYSEQELLGASLKDIHPPEEVANDLQRFQAVSEGRVSINEDRPVLRKDGSIFYADITGHRILYGERPCTLALFRDITERRLVQEALRKEHRTLKHLLQSSDHERQLIAYDIHDGLAQQLAGAIMQMQTFQHLKDNKPALAAKAFEAGMTMLQQGHYDARRLIAGVRPPILDESGVVAAVGHLVNEPGHTKGPNVEYRSSVSFERLAPTLENTIYRIAQEGLANARQHSQSEKVRVSLMQEGDRLRIEIRDWGVGFDPTTLSGNRFGLEGIRERARLLGGKCSIRSKPGKGTAVVVELPVVEREPD